MKKKYNAKRNGFIYIIILFSLLPIGGWWLGEKDDFIVAAVLSLPVMLLLWIYFDTWYMINHDNLFYRSAFLRGSIPIKQIEKVTIGKTMWSGTKPAMAKNGLIIHYKFNDIYIAPQNNEELVADLKAVNPQIIFIK